MAVTQDPTSEPVEPGSIVAVTHYMPAAKAELFQRQAAEWLAAGTSAGSAGAGLYTPPFPRNYGPKNSWELPEWTEADLPAARWVLADLSERQRLVAANLITIEQHGMWSSELRDAAGYGEVDRMSGVFRAIAGRCRACGRRPFWNGGTKDPAKGMRLTITLGATLEVFRKALEEDWPELL